MNANIDHHLSHARNKAQAFRKKIGFVSAQSTRLRYELPKRLRYRSEFETKSCGIATRIECSP